MECPLCKKSVHSDATANACNLCGMPLEKSKTLVVRTEEDALLFCSQRCRERFAEMTI